MYRCALALSLVVVAALACWILFGDFYSSAHLLREAKIALVRGDLSRAEKLAQRLASRPGHVATGSLLAAEAATKLGRPHDAIGYYAAIADDGSPASNQALLLGGDIKLNLLHQLTAAEQDYRRILAHDPQELATHYRIAYILGLEGRSWEAAPHRLELIRGNRRDPIQLVLLALGDTAEENFHLIEDYLLAAPDDPGALTARAWMHIRREELSSARTLLQRATAISPELMTAQAWLGRCLLNQPAPDFLKWHKSLPAGADQHPEIWFVRGRWAQANSQPQIAARCFWESIRIDPEYIASNFHLGTLLTTLGDKKAGAEFLNRARLLGDYTTAAKSYQFKNDPEKAKAAALLAEELGLWWEAWGWNQQFNQLRPDQPQITAKISQLRRQLEELGPQWLARSHPTANPALQIDLRSSPLPDWQLEDIALTTPKHTDRSTSNVTFTDLAESAGIRFQFRNGSLPDSKGDFMFEITGGGVGVLDYDGDGWPDLHFTQGSDWPPRPDQTDYLDQMYRNLGNGRFAEVSALAGIFENQFSQGPAVGDFDQDGFPDLYISNIGRSRLFHNNGDGTFLEMTEHPVTASNHWTISSMIADLNGDGLPDLYTVNYLEGKDIFTRPCGPRTGTDRAGCSPHEYAAAPDQLFLNLGDGRFAERTTESGIDVPDGKGMGIVAADFDGSGQLGLFVGNDAVPNFFFVNETERPGGEPRFRELAYATGLAVDADGRAQACMGVAAGDANGDGHVDIFVTNFRSESNTLYLKQSSQSFGDETRRTGLREPSFDMLGFGTQFLDGELDGMPDLVVANGHIGNLSESGIPYEMPPQYFRNLGEARFAEVSAEILGPYFQGKWLGRGLARLDWNRDGKEDFAVSHLSTPAALVTNQTPEAGHFIAIQLRGTKSNRDAIGAQVTVTCASRTWTQQLTAGDGYQASNHRQLIFGIGKAEKIDKLEVRWLAGEVQTCGPVSIDREYLILEGRRDPVPQFPSR